MTLTFLKSANHFSCRMIWLLNPHLLLTGPGGLWSSYLADKLPTKTLNPYSSLQENYEWVFNAGILISHWKNIQRRKVNIGSDTKELCPPSTRSTETQEGIPPAKHDGNVIQEREGGQCVPLQIPLQIKEFIAKWLFCQWLPSSSPKSSFVLSWLRAAEFVTSQEAVTCQDFWGNPL